MDKILSFAQKAKPFIKLFFGLPLTIISFIFIGNILYSRRESIQTIFTHSHKPTILLGMLFLILFFLLKGFVWKKLLELKGYPIRTSTALYYYNMSELRRYTPGNIFSFITRVASFERMKIPRRVLIKCVAIDVLLLVTSSIFISLISLTYFINAISLIIGIFIFSGILLYIFKKKWRTTEQYEVLIFFLCITWLMYGFGNYLIASSFATLNPYFILQFTSLFVLSWLIGYVSLVTPMGLGIRELAASYALSFVIPFALATSIAVICRVLLIASELLALGIVFLNYKFVNVRNSLHYLFKRKYTAALIVAVFTYCSYFLYVCFEKYNNFFTGRFDLGNMDQTVWNTFHGRIFQLTNPDGVNIISRLSIHADFLLILIAPLYAIWEDPRMLIFVQTIIIGIGAFFVYAIATTILKNKTISFIFALSYLLNPFIQKQTLFDFHSITLSTTFLLAMFYFYIKKNDKLTILFLLLATLAKENMFLVSFLFGLFIFFKDKKKIGLIITCISFVAFYLLVSKFIPEARGSNHFALSYYQDLGDSPFKIIQSLITNPIRAFGLIANAENIAYLAKLLLPVGFISLLSPVYLIFALPDLVINMLSSNRNLTDINFHYGAVIIPFVYISAIYGARKIRIPYRNVFNIFLLTFTLLATWLFGSLPGSRNPAIEVFNQKLDYRDEISILLKKIPEHLFVAASNNLGSHLSHRQYITTIPTGLEQADVVVFLLNDQFAQPSLTSQIEMTNKLKQDKNYVQIYNKNDFIVFKKKNVDLKL